MQALESALAQAEEKAHTKMQLELFEREYTIRQEISKEFRTQLTEIEEEYGWVMYIHTYIHTYIHNMYVTLEGLNYL